MNSVAISDRLYPKLLAFKEVIEAVLSEHLAFGAYTELVLEEGMEAILEDLLDLSDHQALVRSFYDLSTRHPMQVFEHVAQRIRSGDLPARGRRTRGDTLGAAFKAGESLERLRRSEHTGLDERPEHGEDSLDA